MHSQSFRDRNKKRTNRNFFIISIGFVCVLVTAIFGTQNLFIQAQKQKAKQTHILHCEIENQADTQSCKINVGDVILFEAPLPPGKTIFEHNWHFDSTKAITIHIGDEATEVGHIPTTDSINYLMIELTPKLERKISIY